MNPINDPPSSIAHPKPIVVFIEATNRRDLNGLVDAFADDALVNDQLRDYWGRGEIEGWAVRDIIGERLSMTVVRTREHHGHLILTANVDGNFDKRGLPDPLVLTFYFSVASDKIVQLIILRNRSGT